MQKSNNRETLKNISLIITKYELSVKFHYISLEIGFIYSCKSYRTYGTSTSLPSRSLQQISSTMAFTCFGIGLELTVSTIVDILS